ncbi:MAG: alpha-hydroxy-acid oxidizing protein [Ramlibacter sp.]|uniref:alpha-hydroxy acid oxidase n=1 Tax=Ramlibacter sp. TaxID=1917967 RepID=UPI0026276249|nr:alpha-hydroxy acid oxidase [Ramlibacter sp.]MDB5751208.1 alpha-hydroxy-acid oxidizing protein [Ramlibacter sp.]
MIFALDDFEAVARKRLPRCLYGFAANGSERGASVHANAQAYQRWGFMPQTLVDVSNIRQDCSLFGRRYASPVGVAPMGGCALFAHRADEALAAAAHAQRVPFVLSAASSTPLERVLEVAPATWYQGYMPGEEGPITSLLARLKAAKVEVLVLTVDVPVASNRDRDRRLGFSVPLRPTLRLAIDGLMHPRWLAGTFVRTLLADGVPLLPNFSAEGPARPIIAAPSPVARQHRDRFTWDHVRLARRLWHGRLVLKGVLSPADVGRAAEAGADAVILSNHGGRQLDGAVAPLDVLPQAVEAAGAMPVCIDGGVRRGTDVLKALALGARMVFVGRPMLYAASVAGQRGVEAAIQILRAEIATSLALLGCVSADRLCRDHLRAL